MLKVIQKSSDKLLSIIFTSICMSQSDTCQLESAQEKKPQVHLIIIDMASKLLVWIRTGDQTLNYFIPVKFRVCWFIYHILEPI